MSQSQQPRVKVTYGRKNRRSVAATPDSRAAASDAVSPSNLLPDTSNAASVANQDQSGQTVPHADIYPSTSAALAPPASTSTVAQPNAPQANLIADDGTTTPIPSPQPAAKRPKMVHRMSSRSSASASPEKARARDTSASPRKLIKTTSLPLTGDASRSPSPSKDKSPRKGASLPSLDQGSLPPSPAKRRLFTDQLDVPAASTGATVSASKLKHTYGKSAAQQTKGDDEAALLEPLPHASTSTSQTEKSGSSTLQAYLKTRDSYRDMRKRLGVDDSSDEDDRNGSVVHHGEPPQRSELPDSKRKRAKRPASTVQVDPGPSQLQGITTLRAQGQRKQFEDELSYVLEGLQGTEGDQPSVALKRSTAMDLLQRLKEDASEFTRAVRTFGAWPRLASALLGAIPGRGHGDAILEACFVLFILFCAQDQRDAESLFVPSAPHVVSRLLDIMSGPHAATNLSASCPRFGTSQDKKAAERFYALTCGEDDKLWHLELYKPKEMTLERLGIHAIERLCDAEPVGFLETLCHGSGFDLVHGIEGVLERELRKHAEIPVQIESAVDEEEACRILTLIEKCLKIEEYALQSAFDSPFDVSVQRRPLIMQELVSFIWCCHRLSLSKNPLVHIIALTCQVIGLKVIIALSASLEICIAALTDREMTIPILGRLFAASTDVQHRPKKSEAQEAVSQLSSDVTCLLLAVFTLLVESDPSRYKDELRTPWFGEGCSSACMGMCSCEGVKRVSILEMLSSVYARHSTSTEATDDAIFIRDYTSLLLGTLMVDCEANEKKVHECLSKVPQAVETMKVALLAYGSKGGNADAHTSAAIQAIVSRWS